jgi:hypothetical protein
MRALSMTILFLAGFAAVQADEFDVNQLFSNPSPPIEVAGNCTLDREATAGSKKYCYYECIEGQKTLTINANEYCPIDLD